MNSLIIGLGEIGSSLYKVLQPEYKENITGFDSKFTKADYCELLEVYPVCIGNIFILHICFPYSEHFIPAVESYQRKYKPDYTIIHSTVPVGTSTILKAIHSPCIGKHPNLSQSLKTFIKFLGGKDAGTVSDYFIKAGIKVYITDKPESTELMKLLSTLFYSVMIEFTKETKIKCKKYDVPFELFTLWNKNYNEGYEKLGYPEYKKPLLIPNMQKLGGHCLVANTELIVSKFSDFIKSLNDVCV